jgi:hypothetical protein
MIQDVVHQDVIHQDVVQINNHSFIAQNNLLTQDDKPNIKGLLNAIIAPLQSIENNLFELYKNRSLTYATGCYLDGIGAIIGELRDYRNDADYRLAILVRIISNNGGGTAEEIIVILSSIYKNSQIAYTECGQAFFQIHIQQEAKPIGINQLLRKLKPVGVSTPIVSHSDTDCCFQFSESNKEVGTLIYATGDIQKTAKTASDDNIDITFGTFESSINALAFAEIIVNKSDLKLSSGNKYLIAKKKKLQILRGYHDFKIKGGGAFSELITNE